MDNKEIYNERLMEYVREHDDGDFETWKENNLEELHKLFFENVEEQFEDFCKDEWREYNDKNN